MAYEVKNNMYHGLPINKLDGSQIILGDRTNRKMRRAIIQEGEANTEQLRNLANLNIVSVKKVETR